MVKCLKKNNKICKINIKKVDSIFKETVLDNEVSKLSKEEIDKVKFIERLAKVFNKKV